MLLGLGAPVQGLGLDVFRLGLDAGLTSRKITVDFDSIHSASLIRVNPVVTFSENKTSVTNFLLSRM
jgi:hypothetical protein